VLYSVGRSWGGVSAGDEAELSEIKRSGSGAGVERVKEWMEGEAGGKERKN
jgi:hypothetical protein